jgi:Zn-dependent protease
MFEIPPTPIIIAEIIVLFLGIGIHEYAHCKFADMAGDPTPRAMGRVTLNLTKHFEPIGTMMMILSSLSGFGIGWGRPAPMDPRRMRNPRWDFFAAVAAGPLSNVLQAIVYAVFLRMFLMSDQMVADPVTETIYFILRFGVAINLGLFFFNLIPFGPLDGHWLIGLLLPEKIRIKWFQFCYRVGMPGLIVLVLFLNFSHIPLSAGPVEFGYRLLTGKSWSL